ncbi:MAG: nuclear transport factor 2 family protein [Dehalococcoidia bacterium]
MTAQDIDTSLAATNAEIVRRGYAAFNAADIETLTSLFHEDAAWHTPGRGIVAGDRSGRDAVFGHFGIYGGETAGTFRAELRDVIAGNDGRVIAMHHNSGDRNGKHLDIDCCLVFQIEDGRVVDGREYFYDLHAWDEFWS